MPPAVARGFVAVDWNGTVVPFFGLPPYPGALECLARVRAAGLPVVVVSCAEPEQIRRDVRRVGLAADEVYGCPDKGPVLAGLVARLGRGTLVGDHPADLRAALEAGADFVQARPEEQDLLPGARHSFVDWPELLLLLGEVVEPGAARRAGRDGA